MRYARVSTARKTSHVMPFDGERDPTRAEPGDLRPLVTLVRHNRCGPESRFRSKDAGSGRRLPTCAHRPDFAGVDSWGEHGDAGSIAHTKNLHGRP